MNTCVLNFAAVTYSFTSAVKRNCAKITIHRLRVTFSHESEFMEAKKLPPSSSDLNLVNFLLWRAVRALQQKLYHQDFRDLDHLKHVLLH